VQFQPDDDTIDTSDFENTILLPPMETRGSTRYCRRRGCLATEQSPH
jgi:hypothetical protein